MMQPQEPAADREEAAWIHAGLEITGGYQVVGALDAPAPGNWALVVQAASPGGPVALKIMRGRHLGRPEVYNMFAHEARVLARFGTRIAAAGLRAQGYLHPPSHAGAPAPADLYPDAEAFERALTDQLARGGRPFLALDLVPAEATVLALLRGLSHGSDDPVHNRTVPLTDALAITRAALDILAACHAERLYFIDHKPEHLLWRDGTARFLDWNGGDWKAGSPGGSLPRADDQLDVLNFIGYVAYPLFTGRQLDGKAVQSMQRGTPQPPAVHLADGELLPFYEAAGWLDPALQRLLSRPFWNPGARFGGAAEMVAALRDYEQAWRRDSAGMDRQVARALTDLATAQSTLARALHRFDRVLGGTLFKRPAVERPPAAREVQRLAQHVQRFYSARVLPEGVATGARPPDPDPTDGPTPAGAEPVVVTVADYRTLQITFARLAATDPPWVMLADAGFASWLDSLIRAAGGRTTGNHKLLGAAQLLEEAISAAPHPPAPAGREPQTPTLGPALAPQALVEILGQLGIGTIQQTKMTTTYHALAEKVTQQRQAALHDPVWQAAWAVFQVAAALAEEMERVTHEAPASSGVRPFARRVGRVLHEQIGIVLHTPGRVPAQVPVATMVWVESGVFRRPRAVAAAREAVSAAVGLFPPARAVGDLDRYKAELVALCMPGSGPLARLCEQVAPFGEVASAILVGARGAAFADIQAALAAGQPAQARNWFEAATR